VTRLLQIGFLHLGFIAPWLLHLGYCTLVIALVLLRFGFLRLE